MSGKDSPRCPFCATSHRRATAPHHSGGSSRSTSTRSRRSSFSRSPARPRADRLPFCYPSLSLVVDVVGGGVQSFFLRVMVGTGYPHPAQCEFAYPPRLHRLHNYTVLCRMDCCLSILHQWSQKKYSSGWRVGGCSLLDTTTKGRPVCRFHDV